MKLPRRNFLHLAAGAAALPSESNRRVEGGSTGGSYSLAFEVWSPSLELPSFMLVCVLPLLT
jgi:hypothetical protein